MNIGYTSGIYSHFLLAASTFVRSMSSSAILSAGGDTGGTFDGAGVSPARVASPHGKRGGFSLVEVLFAILILGIGFIMIAGVFPVTIQQQQATIDETTGLAVARNGLRQIKAIVRSSQNMVDTLNEVGFSTKLEAVISGERICREDSRFAWIPMYYGTDGNNQKLHCWIVAVRCRNAPAYTLAHLQRDLRPALISNVRLIPATATTPDLLQFPAATVNSDSLRAATGAFVIVANDADSGKVGVTDVDTRGYVFRLGNAVGDPINGVWELDPGMNKKDSKYLFSNVFSTNNLKVLIVGRGLRDCSAPFHATNNPYEGPAQDVAIFPTNDDRIYEDVTIGNTLP